MKNVFWGGISIFQCRNPSIIKKRKKCLTLIMRLIMGKPAKSVIARNTKLKTSMADLSRDASMTEAKMAAFNEIMLSGL